MVSLTKLLTAVSRPILIGSQFHLVTLSHEGNPVAQQQSWFTRHEFLIRRLHSLSGLVPVGAYLCVHLITNSLILIGETSFQNAVYQIHSLGPLLWTVEWGFIFLPIIFHAVVGVVIMLRGQNNVAKYQYANNIRYYLQRVTGGIALVFIFLHVFHLHGWLHIEPYLNYVAEPLGGAQFRPYNAGSTVAMALQASPLIAIGYAIGVLSSVFHFANGIWTMGITWGVWTTPVGQRRANYVVTVIGVIVSVIGLSAMGGFLAIDADDAKMVEDRMYEKRTEDGSVIPNPHKRLDEEHGDEEGEKRLTSGK